MKELRILVSEEDETDLSGLVYEDGLGIYRVDENGTRTLVVPFGGSGIPQGGPLTVDLNAATHSLTNLGALNLTHTVTVTPAGSDEPSVKIGESTTPPDDGAHAQLYADSGNGNKLTVKETDGTIVVVGAGGGGGSVALFNIDIGVESSTGLGTILNDFRLLETLPVDPVGLTYGDYTRTLGGSTPQTYTPGAKICEWNGFVISKIDTRVDAYDLSARWYITNVDGSEFLVLNGAKSANSGIINDTASILPADMSVSSSAGADLTYDPITHAVTTTAGGTYSLGVSLQGIWD